MAAIRKIAVLGLLVFLGACASKPEPGPIPVRLSNFADIKGFEDVRYMGDTFSITVLNDLNLQERQRKKQPGYNPKINRKHLLLSGGMGQVAYGAGLTAGWSMRKGGRPKFEIITGVSAGAMLAPFLFLGPQYDKSFYDALSSKQTDQLFKFSTRKLLSGAPAIASPKKLRTLINENLSDAMVHDIGKEYFKGRRLYVGTTNMDTQRPVIWDITKIAASANPNAPALVRKVILASASIPAAFPPVEFTVKVEGSRNGKTDTYYVEHHADGGIANGVFYHPGGLGTLSMPQVQPYLNNIDLFIIINGRALPVPEELDSSALSLATRSLRLMLRAQTMKDIRLLHAALAPGDNTFRLTYLPREFNAKSQGLFDLSYMRKLYRYAYDRGRAADFWLSAPPTDAFELIRQDRTVRME